MKKSCTHVCTDTSVENKSENALYLANCYIVVMFCTCIQEVCGLSLGEGTSCHEIFFTVCSGRWGTVGAILVELH